MRAVLAWIWARRPRLIWVDKGPVTREVCIDCQGSGLVWPDGTPADYDPHIMQNPNLQDCRPCQGRGQIIRRADA